MTLLIDGGDGNDEPYGGNGDDTLQGGAGNDRLDAGWGVNRLTSGSGTDHLDGGAMRDALKLAELLNQLHRAYQPELQVARVPDCLVHCFDAAAADGAVQKTMRRQVVTLELGRFEAWEVVRTTPQGARVGSGRDPPVARSLA